MKVFFVGAASQARLCYNILKSDGHEVPTIFDWTKGIAPSWDCVVFDDEAAIPKYASTCDAFLVCIGAAHGEVRTRYSRQLKQLGLKPISAIHPTAFFGQGVVLGEGLQALTRSTVVDYAQIGDFCILNSSCTVDHECVLGTGVHVMGAAALAGGVTVGDFSTIGTNATVLPGIRIGANSYVGAGAVVTRDVPDNAVVVGIPARVIRQDGRRLP